jgi:aminoglycoside 2''-phosphotransferase
MKYTFLKGKFLSEYAAKDLSNNPENARVIADFLIKLHSIDISELEGTYLKTIHTLKYWEKLYSSVKSDVFPYLNNQQQDEVNEIFINFINSYPSLSYKKSIIHGDLTTSNIIYNKKINRVDGIVDFTDTQIGDPAFDFAGLYWTFGTDFTKEVLSWYSTSELSDSIFRRVNTFYGLQPVFHELLYAIKNNQKINWESTIERFSYLKTLATL